MSGQQRMTVYLAAIIGVTIFSVVVGSMLAFNQWAACSPSTSARLG